MTAEVTKQLAALAKRYPNVKLDREAGVELVARVAAAVKPKATWSVSDNDVDIDERGEILLGGDWDVWRSVRWVMLGTKPATHLSETLDEL